MMRRRRWALSGGAITVITALLVFVVATLIKQVPDASITITVDLTVESAGTTELFVNAETGGQSHQAFVTTGRQTSVVHASAWTDPYDSRRPARGVGSARHDSSDRHHRRGRSAIGRISGADLGRWLTFNADDVVSGADGLSLITSTSDTAVAATVDIRTGGGRPEIIETIVQWLEQPWLANVVVLGLPIAILSIGLLRSRRWGALPLVLGPIAVLSGDSARWLNEGRHRCGSGVRAAGLDRKRCRIRAAFLARHERRAPEPMPSRLDRPTTGAAHSRTGGASSDSLHRGLNGSGTIHAGNGIEVDPEVLVRHRRGFACTRGRTATDDRDNCEACH